MSAELAGSSMEKRMPAEISILLVDDNAVQAATRQIILRRAGFCVFAALNPERALVQLRGGDFHSEIQLVITDHIMPGMSGTEFVRQIRETHTHLPVLVISGMEEAEEEYAGLHVDFLLKPLPPEKLIETAHRLTAQNGLDQRHTMKSETFSVHAER